MRNSSCKEEECKSVSVSLDDSARSKEAEVSEIVVQQVPQCPKTLPDYGVHKFLKRLFRRGDEIDLSSRKETGTVSIKYKGKQDAGLDREFVMKFYGWKGGENESELVWDLKTEKANRCNKSSFPLLMDSFRISYMPADIQRATLKTLFPDARSISISKRRVTNKLITCLKFVIGEAVLKFEDPQAATENYRQAQNVRIDGVKIQVMEDDQSLLLSIERSITIKGISDKTTECYLKEMFPTASDVTIHKSPEESCNTSAKVWFPSHMEARAAYDSSWLAKISPLWLDFICPYAIKVSNLDSRAENNFVVSAIKEMMGCGAKAKIKCQRGKRSIHIYFKTCKAAEEGFEYFTKELGWETKSSRHVISGYLPPSST